MPTHVLGISCFYHDSAAALLRDGRVVAAAQEERFTRKRHDSDFPAQAIRYVLKESGIGPEQIDAVGFYDKPLLKFERMLSTYVATFPRSFNNSPCTSMRIGFIVGFSSSSGVRPPP